MRIVLAATLVAAALRLFRLGHQSLWIDEVFTWMAAGAGGHFGMRDLLENVHGALYAYALHLWMGLAGQSEWALRFPSALAGVLTVPAMAWLARRWVGRDAVAPAAWLAAGSPFLIWYAQETRGYAWLMLFTTLSAAALLELQRRCDARGVVRYVALTAMAAGSNLSIALLAPLHLRWWFSGEPATRRPRALALALVAGGLLLAAAPWLPQVASTWDWSRLKPTHAASAAEAPLRGQTTNHIAAAPFALHAFAVGYTLGPSLRELRQHAGMAPLRRHAGELLMTALVFGVLGIRGLLALARRGRLADTCLWLIAPGVLVSYFAAQNFKVFHPRYLTASLPCFLLVLAAAFADLRGRGRVLLAVAVAGLWSVSLYQHYFDPAYAREDYRGALAAVRAHIAPGEQVLAVGSEEAVYWYAKGLPHVGRLWLGYVSRPGRMSEKLADALAQADGTWVVLSRSEDLDPADEFVTLLKAKYPDAWRWSGPGVRLWHLPKVRVAARATP